MLASWHRLKTELRPGKVETRLRPGNMLGRRDLPFSKSCLLVNEIILIQSLGKSSNFLTWPPLLFSLRLCLGSIRALRGERSRNELSSSGLSSSCRHMSARFSEHLYIFKRVLLRVESHGPATRGIDRTRSKSINPRSSVAFFVVVLLPTATRIPVNFKMSFSLHASLPSYCKICDFGSSKPTAAASTRATSFEIETSMQSYKNVNVAIGVQEGRAGSIDRHGLWLTAVGE